MGSFPAFSHWAEWNGKYRDELRSFLKGDYWLAPQAVKRIAGSPDLYRSEKDYQGYNSSVNFITCHDGFTLCDLYSYNQKHNEDNGWNNTDGTDDNRSWNCGTEGLTDDERIIRLRLKLMKNACAVLLCSRGTPMLLSGDEFGFSKHGNNNTYCQDNELSWLDWGLVEKNQELFQFVRKMIHFRKEHKVIGHELGTARCGFPAVSVHTLRAWDSSVTNETRTVAVMFAGYDEERETDDIVYLAVNPYWEEQYMELPKLPAHSRWRLAADTSDEQPERSLSGNEPCRIGARSVMVLTAAECK